MKESTTIATVGLDPFANHGVVNPPVYHASTILFPTLAEWRASRSYDYEGVRYGRSARVTITVQGWEHEGGIWQPNSIVEVKDDWLGIGKDRNMLIAQTTHILDASGSRPELVLYRPAAFARIELPEPEEEELW